MGGIHSVGGEPQNGMDPCAIRPRSARGSGNRRRALQAHGFRAARTRAGDRLGRSGVRHSLAAQGGTDPVRNGRKGGAAGRGRSVRVKILLTGRNGQVGWELERALPALGEVIATDRSTLNLSDPDAIRKLIREVKPSVIVNAAAYTAVDKAESEPERAIQIDAIPPGILAEETKRRGNLLVHFSTDYIFDGTKSSPYVEDDAPNPLNVYGKTKLEGERRIAASGC